MSFNHFLNYNQVLNSQALNKIPQIDQFFDQNEVVPFYQFNNELETGYNQTDRQINYNNNLPQNYQLNSNHQFIEPRNFLELDNISPLANNYDAFIPYDSPYLNNFPIDYYDQGRSNEINDQNHIHQMQEYQLPNIQQLQTIHCQNSPQQPQQDNQFTTMQTQLRNSNQADIYQNKIVTNANTQQQTTQNFYQSYEVTNQQINSKQITEFNEVEKESEGAKGAKKIQRKPSNQIYALLEDKVDETKNLLRNYGDNLKKDIKQMSEENKDYSFWIEQILDIYMNKKNIDNQKEFRLNFIQRYKDFSFSNFEVVREEWTVSPNQSDYHLKNAYRQVCFHFFTKQPLRYIYKSTNKINKRNQRFTHLYYLKVFIQGILDPKKFQKFKDSSKVSQKKTQKKKIKD
ncbi:hypothetical protein ABPG72_013268 [Tetrahymena utriculariae]